MRGEIGKLHHGGLKLLLAIPTPTVRCSIKILVISFGGWLLGIKSLWAGIVQIFGGYKHLTIRGGENISLATIETTLNKVSRINVSSTFQHSFSLYHSGEQETLALTDNTERNVP